MASARQTIRIMYQQGNLTKAATAREYTYLASLLFPPLSLLFPLVTALEELLLSHDAVSRHLVNLFSPLSLLRCSCF